MELTQEQLDRMHRNRERALAIQKRKREEREAAAAAKRQQEIEQQQQKQQKRRKLETSETKDEAKKDKDKDDADDEETKLLQLDVLEQFEENASSFVTKKEAMKMYCLPQGTLAVCECEERENPHHKGWTPMKMYKRTELRRRARKRFGGMQGLIEERQQRQEKRLMKDMAKAEAMFKRK
mmetsp:Transcript_7126/g.19336  ORF Transcript_7126/g.19336 Transcript_7126/m.19336 type:complete len:180 (-) Transcript_7126:697-1236(-)